MQPNFPIENEPQFLIKHMTQTWGGGRAPLSLLFFQRYRHHTLKGANLLPGPERPSGSGALFILFAQLHVFESYTHLLRVVLLKHQTVDREAEDPASGQEPPIYPVMLPAPCFSLPQFSHLQGGQSSLP